MSDRPDDVADPPSGAPADRALVTVDDTGSPSWTKFAAPLVVVALAVGGAALVLRPGDDGRIRTADAAPEPAATDVVDTSDDPLFRSAGDVTEDAPVAAGVDESVAAAEADGSATAGGATDASATDAVTTESPAPSDDGAETADTTAPTSVSLPAQPAQPIAPPADPNGFEDQIQLGRLSIPSLGVDEPLLEGIRLTTLDNGPGHWPGTAMPGEVGNVVVAGHRTSHGAVFRDIDQLVPGDVVTFTVAGEDIEYHVTGSEIVEPDAVWIVDPTSTPTATLFACHPPGSTRQRIVVFLELAS